MNQREEEAFNTLKDDLYNYPKVIMITVERKDLELVINYLEKEKRKNDERNKS